MRIVEGIGHEGSLVLAKILKVNARKEMESLCNGKITDFPLFSGEYIIGVLANRHSGTSEYGQIPKQGIKISKGRTLDLLAAGGIIGNCLDVPKSLGDKCTKISCLGLLADKKGEVINLKGFHFPWDLKLSFSAPIVLLCGTAAEIGKTTTGACLIKGLKKQGIKKVVAAKLAGTGRKRDIDKLAKAGAFPAYDFPDVGLPTTYDIKPTIYSSAIYTLFNKLNKEGNPQIIIAECGGDIIEGNIPTLLKDNSILKNVIVIVHCSTDVLAIMGSLILYKRWGIFKKIPIYLTYPIGRNNKAIAQRLKDWRIDLPIFDPMDKKEIKKVVKKIVKKISK